LSIQSILITSKIIGSSKTWVYVGLVTIFATAAGLLYGAWWDGTSIWLILAGLAVFLGLLIVSLWVIGRRSHRTEVLTDTQQP
jgi:membrane protein YdbS with pleckstrin-like domain